jgi:photosynthetic reaction center H subunit
MQGAVTGYIDVAQLTLYAFWIFFAGLIYYLRTEDKREGYPLVTERGPDYVLDGFPPVPSPKAFHLQDGRTVYAPRLEDPEPSYNAVPMSAWPGAPMETLGNAMLSNAGPAASALRADIPDVVLETGGHRVVPLRVATDHSIDLDGPDPIGMQAVGADGIVGGVITDVWVDRIETMIRYYEVALVSGATVLVPMPLVNVIGGVANVVSVMGDQFADAPRLANPDQVTLREEDRIQAYFASGHMFAEPSRSEPLL